ncbi:endonuclease [Thalassococcus sp.]|uniref:endonuclease n=1 Tax=Thalassococcus sp. TaxID=1928858 RepID=UPI00257FE397|nr:endonuclease [Thalassococcus sp.]
MGEPKNGMSCSTGCWALAAGIGLITFVILMIMSGFSFFAALFLGLLVFVLSGLLFNWLFCAGNDDAASTTTGTSSTSAPAAAAASGAAAATPAAATPASTETSDAVKSKTTLAGEDELASRKGDWKYEGDAASDASASADAEAPAASAAVEPAATEASAASASTSTAAAPVATPVKSNTTLAGEEELASRKGEWKYEAPAKEKAPAKKAAAKKAPAKKAPAKKAAAPEAATDAGTKPATLDKPRAGGADDLKMIKGVGPKLEEMLHSLGFYHYDQVAAWKDAEVAWVDQNLKGFKGRATRDAWVEQAKLLAAGEETEFSKRASKDGTYK